MIKPEDLRIGNWLQFEDKPVQVESIDPLRELPERNLKCSIQIKEWLTDIHYTFTGKWLNRFEPIQLDTDWLERCGRKCEKGNGWEYQIQVGALNWYFRWNTEWYSEVGGIYIDSRVQYVHQLQNLYFAFTGKEIEIKQK